MRDPEISKHIELLKSKIETFFQEKGIEIQSFRVVNHMNDNNVEVIVSFSNIKTNKGLNIYFRSYGPVKNLFEDLNYTFWTASEHIKNLPIEPKNSIGANDPPCAMMCMFYQKKGTINELYNHYSKCQ